MADEIVTPIVTPIEPVVTPTKVDETVSKAEFDKVMAELHKHKGTARTLAEQIKTANESKMKEQNQWKELAEAREKEALDAKNEADTLRKSFVSNTKFGAVKEKCAALGLRPEAMSDLEMLDLEQIQVETTSTGKMNILGADKFAERLKTIKPHWFADKKTAGVNTTVSQVLDSGAEVTAAMIYAAEKEALKTGDSSKYQALFNKFQQQRAQEMRR